MQNKPCTMKWSMIQAAWTRRAAIHCPWLSTVGVPLGKSGIATTKFVPTKAAPTSVGSSFMSFFTNRPSCSVLLGPCQFTFFSLSFFFVNGSNCQEKQKKKINSEQRSVHAMYPVLIRPDLAWDFFLFSRSSKKQTHTYTFPHTTYTFVTW